jgi:xanthosine utilization system XapX-like protein
MSGESPIAALGVFIWMVGYSVVHLADGLPNPAEPAVVTILGAVGAFVGATFHLARKRAIEGIQLTGFMFWFVATGIGLAIYTGHLIALGFSP